MEKDNYNDIILDITDIIMKIDIEDFNYLTKLPQYNCNYENCYVSFIENFNENPLSYELFKNVIKDLSDRCNSNVVELMKIIQGKFNSTDDVSFTFVLDMLDAVIYERNEGFCIKELEFLQDK